MNNPINKPWLERYDPFVPHHIDYPDVALPFFLKESARRYPDRACTILGQTVVTFSQMDALTDRLGLGLGDLGVKKGERVAIMMPNLPQFVAAYYAVLKAGGVVVALNPQYTATEAVHLVNETGAVYLIGLHEQYAMLQSIKEKTNLRSLILTTTGEAEAEGESFLNPAISNRLADDQTDLHSSDSWLRNLGDGMEGNPNALPNVSSSDPAIFQYTGGTTGTPKAAIGLHSNLVANTLQFKSWLGSLEEGNETLLVAIPMYHVYGMVLGMNLGTAMGASMVLVPNPRDLDGLLNAIEANSASVFPGVPTLYNAIIRFPDVWTEKYNLRSLKVCISGSAPLSPETKGKFETLISGRLVEGYGLSEAPTATHCNPIQGDNRTGSIGLPLPDVECRIVHLEDGETDLPAGEVGELLIRGPQVMQGYHEMREETEKTLAGGWLHTGDIARMDADGYFYIVDRKKEVIKAGGLQVWPREIEDVLAAHPKVIEAGVIGIPDEIRGEAPKAWVVLKPGETATVDELLAWCRESLAKFKIPVEIEFIERLPRTPVGKLLRRELRRQHEEKTP